MPMHHDGNRELAMADRTRCCGAMRRLNLTANEATLGMSVDNTMTFLQPVDVYGVEWR